ncbi:unnamed protein product [Peniophora sp. CBMAI 1063]|nr:unnamed protein product [Peniophora sp. CBMAI 1063]
MTDATNLMFSSRRRPSDTEDGALWTMISRDDMAEAGRLLGEWKEGQFSGHPIHSQQIVLDADDVQRLRDHKILVWTLIQKPGQAVFIPAGVGHQVTNHSSCIKIAVDFVTPANVMHSSKIGDELREHRLKTDDTEAEDVLQLATMCWWTLIRTETDEYKRARSDFFSDPWRSHYSAAPRYLQVPVRTYTRDDVPANKSAPTVPVNKSAPTPEEPDVPVNESAPTPEEPDVPVDEPAPTPEEPDVPVDEPAPAPEEPGVHLGMDDVVGFDGLSIGPPSSSSTPLPPPSLTFNQTPHSSVPPKRSREHYEYMSPTDRRHKRQKKARVAAMADDPEKTLTCPITAFEKCKRAGDLFKRQQLLNHLEEAHPEYVRFRHPSGGLSKRELIRERQKILGQKGDDEAFIEFLKTSVLGKFPLPSV